MLNVKIKKEKRGVSLYLTILVLSILTASLLVMFSLVSVHFKVILTVGDAVVSFYAADSGIEKTLMDMANPTPTSGSLDVDDDGIADAFYTVTVKSGTSPDCNADNYCITSVGEYKKVKRAIEIRY